ncbi:hypothetical protein ACQCT6_07635 [Cytobacillus gottheilii]|uniref:hypothetical protein n=1 Tax=Cytobacillus gottheilii TaxID=859144 RepID=UPI003CF95D3C
MPVSIVFNQINVNSVKDASSISNGMNNQPDWTWQGKNNFAAGMQTGIVFAAGNLNINVDCDMIDTPLQNNEAVNPQPNVQF